MWTIVSSVIGSTVLIVSLIIYSLQIVNSRFDTVDTRFSSMNDRLLSIEEHLRNSDQTATNR